MRNILLLNSNLDMLYVKNISNYLSATISHEFKQNYNNIDIEII